MKTEKYTVAEMLLVLSRWEDFVDTVKKVIARGARIYYMINEVSEDYVEYKIACGRVAYEASVKRNSDEERKILAFLDAYGAIRVEKITTVDTFFA